MNQSDSVPLRILKPIPATCRVTDAVPYAALIDVGREITRLSVIAEREGDYKTVELLMREKDRIHRLRREL